MTPQHEIEIENVTDRIAFIDRRLSEIESLLQRLNLPPGNYRLQELLSEEAHFSAHRRVADQKLKELTGKDDPVERARREAAIARTAALRASRVKSFRKGCFEAAEQHEAGGDFRNATLTRLQSLEAEAVAEHEIS